MAFPQCAERGWTVRKRVHSSKRRLRGAQAKRRSAHGIRDIFREPQTSRERKWPLGTSTNTTSMGKQKQFLQKHRQYGRAAFMCSALLLRSPWKPTQAQTTTPIPPRPACIARDGKQMRVVFHTFCLPAAQALRFSVDSARQPTSH